MSLYTYNTTWCSGSFNATVHKTAAATIESCLTNLGWVKTADTGQVVISSIAALPGSGASSGYQIWRMDDALQGTYPVYLKFELYQTGSWSFTPAFTIGFATDGAGNLTGNTTTRYICGSSGSSTSSTLGWASGDSSRLTICHGHDLASAACFINIERLKDASGNDTGDGVSFITGKTGSSYYQQVAYPTGTNNTYTSSSPGCLATNSSATAASGADVYVFPCFPIGRGSHNQVIGFLAYYNVDLTTNNAVSVTVYGASESYWPVGILSGSTMGVLAGLCPLVRRN